MDITSKQGFEIRPPAGNNSGAGNGTGTKGLTPPPEGSPTSMLPTFLAKGKKQQEAEAPPETGQVWDHLQHQVDMQVWAG